MAVPFYLPDDLGHGLAFQDSSGNVHTAAFERAGQSG
jgi:hypothetical protein